VDDVAPPLYGTSGWVNPVVARSLLSLEPSSSAKRGGRVELVIKVSISLLTIGAGRGLGPKESPLHRGQFPEPLSIAFTLLTPSSHSMEKIPPQYFILISFLSLYLVA